MIIFYYFLIGKCAIEDSYNKVNIQPESNPRAEKTDGYNNYENKTYGDIKSLSLKHQVNGLTIAGEIINMSLENELISKNHIKTIRGIITSLDPLRINVMFSWYSFSKDQNAYQNFRINEVLFQEINNTTKLNDFNDLHEETRDFVEIKSDGESDYPQNAIEISVHFSLCPMYFTFYSNDFITIFYYNIYLEDAGKTLEHNSKIFLSKSKVKEKDKNKKRHTFLFFKRNENKKVDFDNHNKVRRTQSFSDILGVGSLKNEKKLRRIKNIVPTKSHNNREKKYSRENQVISRSYNSSTESLNSSQIYDVCSSPKEEPICENDTTYYQGDNPSMIKSYYSDSSFTSYESSIYDGGEQNHNFDDLNTYENFPNQKINSAFQCEKNRLNEHIYENNMWKNSERISEDCDYDQDIENNHH